MDKTPLSATRVSTLASCSWLYWAKYVLKIPRDENHGSLRGSISHTVFECLGRERHYDKFLDIVKAKSIWVSPPVARMVKAFCKKKKIDDEENLALINEMILEGLNYDFFAECVFKRTKPTESYNELSFDLSVEEGDKNYRILGLIDKLFLFKGKKLLKIRDFKTSKSVYEEGEVEDNIQDLIYKLAMKKLYPEYKKIDLEFVFVRFSCKEGGTGIIKTPETSDDEFEGFEYYLTEVQNVIDNFDEDSARSNFAYHEGYPEKEEGFCGRLLCGYAKYPGHIKPKTGKPYWHCPAKFPFEYYQVWDEKDKNRKTPVLGLDIKDKEGIKRAKEKGYALKKFSYGGCPVHNNNDNSVLL